MKSRERVLTAVNRQIPDRVPLGFSANAAKLQQIMSDLRYASFEDIVSWLHVDIIDLRGIVDPHYRGPIPKETTDSLGIKENFWGMRTQRVPVAGGWEEMYCDFLLATAQSIDELERHCWPQADWFDFTDFDDRLKPWADFAIMAGGASVWQHASFLRGFENLLADMACGSEFASYLLDKFTDFYVRYFDRMFIAAKGRIDILRIADDLGMQDRLVIDPAMFDRFLAGRIKRLIDMAHSHSVKVMFHSCGSIGPIIERLIELGVDILDPLQTTAADMEPETLKSRYGARLCLHGSIDTQFLLPKASVQEIEANVKRMISVLGENGGFILAPTHVLQTDVPTANIIALYDTGFAYGGEFYQQYCRNVSCR